MIERTYICDLCLAKCGPGVSGAIRPSVRLRFTTAGIEFKPLGDGASSEKMICGKCLNSLKKAMEQDADS